MKLRSKEFIDSFAANVLIALFVIMLAIFGFRHLYFATENTSG